MSRTHSGDDVNMLSAMSAVACEGESPMFDEGDMAPGVVNSGNGHIAHVSGFAHLHAAF